MKTVVIVGATSGIGKSIATQLDSEGYRVFGAGRRVEEQIHKNEPSWIRMDVTDDQSVKEAIQKVIAQTKKIDILIQCAGRGAIGPVEAFTTKEIEEVFQLNLYGVQRVNQAVLPVMRGQNSGRIIMISSLAAESGLPYQGIYCASKAALDVLTESLRMEIKQFGIEACVIQPGDFKTEVAQHRKLPAINPESPYKDQFKHINQIATANVEFAADPIQVAKKISQLLKRNKLKPKYRVGSTIELAMPKAKSILPATWFEKLLMMYYKL